MARAVFRNSLIIAALAGMAFSTPAAAQMFSDRYEFLEAVKDRDGEKVTNALNEPGSVLVNSRDLSSGETALHIVTKRRDVVWIRFLAQRGGNPNIADKNGVTPLMIATSLGFVEGVEALVEAGARVDVTNDAGETPLIAAVHSRNAPLVRMLLKQGANPDRTDNSGRSARDYAVLMGRNSAMLSEIERADEERGGTGEQKTYGPSF